MHKHEAEMADGPRGALGVGGGVGGGGVFVRANGTLFLSSPLTCLIPVPGVVYWTVSNLATGFQRARSAKWIKPGGFA